MFDTTMLKVAGSKMPSLPQQIADLQKSMASIAEYLKSIAGAQSATKVRKRSPDPQYVCLPYTTSNIAEVAGVIVSSLAAGLCSLNVNGVSAFRFRMSANTTQFFGLRGVGALVVARGLPITITTPDVGEATAIIVPRDDDAIEPSN